MNDCYGVYSTYPLVELVGGFERYVGVCAVERAGRARAARVGVIRALQRIRLSRHCNNVRPYTLLIPWYL